MGMAAHDLSAEWTAEMALALPDDGNRYEVLDGELFVTPSPSWRHQSAVEQLFLSLGAYVPAHSLGWAKLSPADIILSPKRLLQPDLFVVPWRDTGTPQAWIEVKQLLLAVEVLSRSTARTDRSRKRLIYQSQRVPEYWIVDSDSRIVERWTPDDTRPEIIAEVLVWQPRPDTEPLRIELPAFFGMVHGEA